MKYKMISLDEEVTNRKMNYWRGFRAACLLFVPIIIFFMVVTNLLINVVE